MTRCSSAVLNSLGLVALLLGAGAASYQVGAAPAAADSAVAPPAHGAKSRVYENWRKSMSRTVVPGPGCHQAEYPDEQWKSVPCTVAPLQPHVPRGAAVVGANTVGAGTDYSAQLQGGGLIAYSEGSFGTSAVASESDNGAANVYTLQLNTNLFATSACNGVSGCIGWQQYVFDNNPAHGTAYVYIQYWLIGYPSNCPAGYTYFGGAPGQASGCYMNSAAVSVPLQVIQNLSALTLTGTAVSGGFDQARTSTGTSLYSTQGADTVLGAGSGWNSAEFNVFGEYNGTQATFGSGTLLSIETLVTNGASTSAPTVIIWGSTAETNNLTLAPLYCQVADPNGPYIWFQETFGATPASTCPVTPISLPAPTVTTTGPTGTEFEQFSFSWPSVSGATYYVMSTNGANGTITGNSAFVGIACQKSVVVAFSSCNAAGCGWPQTVLNARNNSRCN